MSQLRNRVVVATAVMAAAAELLAAQIDYRNLGDDRPSRVEDAYPIERYAFEFVLPYSYSRGHAGDVTHASVLELAYGVLPNTLVGIKAPLSSVQPTGGDSQSGLSGLRVFALYNFNTESKALPAFALRTDVAFPVGVLGGDETQLSLTGIVTRSWGRNRMHLNGGMRLGKDGPGPVVEGLDRWWYGVALDHTLFRQSLLVIGDVSASRESDAESVETNASLGLRWQWRATTVVDLGVRRRLRETGPDFAFTVGFSHAFAIAGLMPGSR